MSRRYTKSELRKMIYGALSAHLSRAACICSDDPEFHDQLWDAQKDMIVEFKKLASGAPPVPD